MKKDNLFFFIFCLLFTSCQHYVSEESDYQEILSFGNESKEIYALQIVGFGGGINKGRKSFDIAFMGNQKPSIDEARTIFYDVSNRFLERLNSNEKLLETSIDAKFSIADLSIDIMFPRGPGYINGIGNGFITDRNPQQFVYFFTYNSESEKSEITYKEPYEQLKSIVEQQRGLQTSSLCQ